MWFAPPDADRITISMSGRADSLELTRTATGWEAVDNGQKMKMSRENKTLVCELNGQRQVFDLGSDVAGIPANHDWKKEPKVTWRDEDTLEKTASGFTVNLSLRTSDGKRNVQVFQISYRRAEKAAPQHAVNVLGAVRTPGIVTIADDARLSGALAAAGGPTDDADRATGGILRGSAGAKPQVIPFHLEAVLSGAEANPKLLDHDTVYLPAKKNGPASGTTTTAPPPAGGFILINVSATGELRIAGIVCPEGQLETRLKELASWHPESITIRAEAGAPNIMRLEAACKAAGLDNVDLIVGISTTTP